MKSTALTDDEMRHSHEEAMAFVADAGNAHVVTPEEEIMRGVLLESDGWRYEVPIAGTTKNGGKHPYRMDFYHSGARICVEVDGKHHYQRGRLRGRDRRRGTRLATDGILTLRYTNRDVMQGLAQVRVHIAEQLAQRLK